MLWAYYTNINDQTEISIFMLIWQPLIWHHLITDYWNSSERHVFFKFIIFEFRLGKSFFTKIGAFRFYIFRGAHWNNQNNTTEKIWKFDRSDENDLTAYDTRSIMHYDGTLSGFFENPIMKERITGKGIEVNRELSQIDIEKLNKMYPCKQTASACGKFWYFRSAFPVAYKRLLKNSFRSSFNPGTAKWNKTFKW